MTMPADWTCPDTLAEITQPARIRTAIRVVVVAFVLGYVLGVVFAWW